MLFFFAWHFSDMICWLDLSCSNQGQKGLFSFANDTCMGDKLGCSKNTARSERDKTASNNCLTAEREVVIPAFVIWLNSLMNGLKSNVQARERQKFKLNFIKLKLYLASARDLFLVILGFSSRAYLPCLLKKMFTYKVVYFSLCAFSLLLAKTGQIDSLASSAKSACYSNETLGNFILLDRLNLC